MQAKLLHMPQEARNRLQVTLERIINEGCDGLICICCEMGERPVLKRMTRQEKERRAAQEELKETMQALRANEAAFGEAQDRFTLNS